MIESTIRLQIESLDNGFLATSPDVPGLIVQAQTLTEIAEIAQDVARKILESYIEHGDPLPDALKSLSSSVPLELRIPVGFERWVDLPGSSTAK